MLVYSLAGELILGSRFKRLSDKYLSNVYRIYREQNIDFEPSWFSIFYLLDRYNQITITDISQMLDLTQSAISQMVSTLESKNLVKVEIHSKDKRVRVVSFTEKGKELLASVKPIWKLIKSKMREMLDEGDNSKYLLDALEEVEVSFERKSLAERVLESLREGGYFFVKYREDYYLPLKRIIFEWMFNFGIPDSGIVNSFKNTVERNRNRILLAVKDREVVASVFGFEKEGDGSVCVVCDREDIDNRVARGLLSKFFETCERPDKVYFDADKPMIEDFLKKRGFKKTKIVEKDDVDKKLAIFEAV